VTPAEALLTPEAVRERSHELHALGLDDRLQAWVVRPEAMAATADLVAEVVRANYPDLQVPFHARWRHFLPDGAATLAGISDDKGTLLRARLDLAIISVLLDAGAGMAWRYQDAATGRSYARSEGLAMASLAMFTAGAFADDGASPRADAARLAVITAEELGEGLQVREDNPLTGLEGRAALLRRLGAGPPDTGGDGSPLTPREREVAALVAEGLTNRELGQRLGIDERSAEGHLERIRLRLGVRSRAQIAAWWVATSSP
jgi:DNA-binding CsgD family transcriptional regulator